MTKIYFITGVSGAGKTTLVKPLQERLDKYSVHDFDEVGVPKDVDEQWRLDTTLYWLNKAHESTTPFIILGSTVPSEILSQKDKYDFSYNFGFIDLEDKDIRQRLEKRGWPESEIQDYMNWNPKLRKDVEQTDNYRIFNSSKMSKEELVEEVIKWVKE